VQFFDPTPPTSTLVVAMQSIYPRQLFLEETQFFTTINISAALRLCVKLFGYLSLLIAGAVMTKTGGLHLSKGVDAYSILLNRFQ